VTHRKKETTMKVASNTGMMLLGVWLILTGVFPLLGIDFDLKPLLLSALAIAAGAMILMNK
jgi:hypothetical protein